MRARRRVQRLAIGAVVALVVLTWLVMAGMEGWRLGADALAGTRAAHTARQSVAGAQDVLDRRPDEALAQAQRHFADASERARSWVLAPFRAVPVVGRQLRAVEAVAIGRPPSPMWGPTVSVRCGQYSRLPHRSGPERLALLRRLADVAEVARARLHPGGPWTRPVVAARVVVARGEEQTVVVRSTLPADQRSLRVEPSGRAPSVAWSFGGATWRDGLARMVAW